MLEQKYVTQLSDEEIKVMMEEYLGFIFDKRDSRGYVNDGSYSRVEGSAILEFMLDNKFPKTVEVDDFNAIVSCAIEPTARKINTAHRKNMYRNFGPEYLDDMDKFVRTPIEKNYNDAIASHEQMLDEIISEDENVM